MSQLLSSVDIAILSKLVDLTRRFGLRASDAEALLSYDSENQKVHLNFFASPDSDEKDRKMDRLLDLLGCPEGLLCTGTAAEMETLIDEALRKAPRPRGV